MMIMGFFLILLFLFINPFFCHASIVLNEIYPAPSTGESEWVELYNNENNSVNIKNFYLTDSSEKKILIINEVLEPYSFAIASTPSGVLNNSNQAEKNYADIVYLYDANDQLIDIATYSGTFNSTKTFAKCPNGGNSWFVLNTPTKNASNEIACQTLTPTPTPFPTETPTPSTEQQSLFPTITPPQPSPTSISEVDYQNIFISEVYPYPAPNDHEWVELYNDNNTQVNLDHWYIDDVENGGSAPKSFSLVIDPYSYGTVTLTSSMFNNDGDVVRLLSSNKQEKDSMEYGKITEEKSMGRISFSEDSYCEQEPSKNTSNSSCLLAPTQLVSSQSTQKTVGSTQKTISPTKKPINQSPQQISTRTNSTNTVTLQLQEEVLGAQTKETPYTSPAPYLSFVSLSYSLLTIVSVFIKMKYA